MAQHGGSFNHRNSFHIYTNTQTHRLGEERGGGEEGGGMGERRKREWGGGERVRVSERE